MRTSATSRPLRDLGLAFTLLTVVPLKTAWPADERPDAAGYFPLAGLALGGCVSGIAALLLAVTPASRDALSALLVASVLVASLGLLTRFLHWDALADVADATGGASTPQHRLEILGDPHVGAFGVSALVCAALLQVAALALLVHHGALIAIAIAPALARYAAVFGAWFGRPARPQGLGASVTGAPRAPSVVAAGCVLVALTTAVWVADPALGAGVLAGLFAALVTPHLVASRFGGVTGDVLGSGVMLTETVVLVAFAITR